MAISAARDANRVPAFLGTLDSDGTTIVAVAVNPTNHALKVVDDTTGTDYVTLNAQRDANRIPALWGVSSVDGVTPVSIYTDSTNHLLIDST